MPRPSWTDEEIEFLRARWKEGDSASEIGRKMGRSKNSVIGKSRDLPDLERRPSPIGGHGPGWKPRTADKEPRQPRESRAKVIRISAIAKPPPPPAPKRFEDAKISTKEKCQFPIGEPRKPGFRLCGKPAVVGHSYCRECCELVYARVAA